jgi:hypothetical protein
MRRDDEFIRQLEGYLDEFEGATPLPVSVRNEIREQLQTVRPLRSRTDWAAMVAVAAAWIVLVALLGFNLMTPSGRTGGPQTSTLPSHSATPQPTPSPRPSGLYPTGGVTIGRNRLTVDGVPFTFSVPTYRWERFGNISLNKSLYGPQGAEAMIFWTGFPDGMLADPCPNLLSLPVGPSAADVADAVSKAPGTELVRGPSDVSVGGRPAKHVALIVREQVGCDPGFFYTWPDVELGALWTMTDVGTTINVWIVDVDEVRLFIAGEVHRAYRTSPDQVLTEAERNGLEQEIQQIIDSIEFS